MVTVFSAETIAPIMEIEFEWDDVFDMTVTPAAPPTRACGSAPRSSAGSRGCRRPG